MDSSYHQVYRRLAPFLPRHVLRLALKSHRSPLEEEISRRGSALVVELRGLEEDGMQERQAFLQDALEENLFHFEGTLVGVDRRRLAAFFPARDRGVEPGRERTLFDLQFSTQRAVAAARGTLDVARRVRPGREAAAAVSVGWAFQTGCGTPSRQVLLVTGPAPARARQIVGDAPDGEIILDPPAFRSIEHLATGEIRERDVVLREWDPQIRETPRVSPHATEYDEDWMCRAVEILLPLVPRAWREHVLEGRMIEERPVVGTLARLEARCEAGEDRPHEEVRAVLACCVTRALELLEREGEDVVGCAGCEETAAGILALLPGGPQRAREVTDALTALLEGEGTVSLDLAEGSFRLSMEGVEQRRWPRVDPLPEALML